VQERILASATTKDKNFGEGQGGIAIANSTVVPEIDPVGGGILCVEDGAFEGSE
jgi:hypothetical protein